MNPILPLKYYTPDVEARLFDDKIYLYGSNDIANNDKYCSYEYNVFSSADMTNWEVHEKTFTKNDWIDADGLILPLFAPDCEYINGRYCLFYCTKGHREGLAFSDKPYGKFTDSHTIKTADGDGIDPTVLVDGGDVYYYWGQQALRGAKLNKALDDVVVETLTKSLLTREKDGFREGASIRKIGQYYYMVFADGSRRGDSYGPTCLSYAISKHPLGPYEKKGVIIDNFGCDPNTWNNHGSLLCFKGKWYVFYHRSSNNGYFSRRVCVEPITINADGSIDEVEMTTQGSEEPIHPTFKFGAEHFCLLGGVCYIKSYTDTTTCYNYLTQVYNGDFAYIKYINFSLSKVKSFTAEFASNSNTGRITVHLDNEDCEIIAEIATDRTYGDYDFKEVSAPVKTEVEGVHAVVLKFHSDYRSHILNLKSFNFS